MFCSHCGKKVTDTMLFCPFCGEPIVIPDQDDEAPDAAPETPARVEAEPEAPAEVPAETPEPEPIPEPEPLPESEPAPEPDDAARGRSELSDAAAELLSWDRDRRSMVEAPAEAADDDRAEEAFSPLMLDADAAEGEDLREAIIRRKQAAEPEKKPPEMRLTDEQTVRLDGRAPALEGGKKTATVKPEVKAHRSANTYVPPKAMNPDDIFMSDRGDAYDRFDDDPYDSAPEPPDDGFEYEEEHEGSFFLRHIRGIVALTLLAILALLFCIYMFTDAGQRSLARVNLAWNKDVYARLAYEYYQAERYDEAGQYYERALSRDPGRYAHAESAASAYVAAKNTEKAAAMLKKCIEIDPARVEPYVYLLNLYPTAAERPWDVTQLVRQGYQLTGDSRLNVEG